MSNRKYGLPFKGSKNKLAERIVRLLPRRTHLIDLFCGGCAVSHAALVMRKYEHIHINDVNWMCPTLFIDALNGKYVNETRWISREEFQELKDTDPYVAIVWSFGNNMKTYLYSKEIEPLKKAIHYAMFFSDYSLGKELGYDLSFVEPLKDVQKRYIAIKHYFNELGVSDNGGGAKTATGILQQDLQTRLNTNLQNWGAKRLVNIAYTNKRPTELQHVEGYNRIQITRTETENFATESGFKELSRLENHERRQHLPIGGVILPITTSVLDYEEVEIPKDSIIYCDIPYEGTEDYNRETTGENSFDYERFYAWCERQTEPVFISSYDMPRDRFDIVDEYRHRCTFAQVNNNLVTERIFVPKHQKERGTKPKQLSLFDE